MLIENVNELDKFILDNDIRNFRSDEFVCKCGCGRVKIESEIVLVLQRLRDYLRKPVIITSAYRCPSYNKEIGGVSSSAHVFGLAVDIACTNSEDRYYIVKFLITQTITRIGIGKDFVHFDLDEEKPSPRIWHYYYKRR